MSCHVHIRACHLRHIRALGWQFASIVIIGDVLDGVDHVGLSWTVRAPRFERNDVSALVTHWPTAIAM